MEKSTLQIDPEFHALIPPLTAEEFEQLRENILADGEVYEPIAVWNNTIIDGHNRWKVIQENWDMLKDRFRIKDLEFPDKWTAFDWMYRKQLGRRNLTQEQRTYMIGRMYELRKQSQGGDHGNQYTKEAGGQNVHLAKADKTADIIGAEFGVTGRSVQRAEKFAQGVDALKEVSPDAAEKVLKGEADMTKAEICEVAKMEPDAVKEIAGAILSDTALIHHSKRNYRGKTQEEREAIAEIQAIADDMYDRSTLPEYTIDTLVDDIQLCAGEFVQQIRNILKDRSAILTDENKGVVAETIDLHIIKEFEKVRDLL